jgi:phytoene dehydrogenase-like protein
MNGYRTQIFELHDKPGGLCTSWQRNGYTFDGCIHWLVGTGPGSGFNRIWHELGALQGRPIVDNDEFVRVEREGKTLILYTDVDRLEQHLQTLAPGDAAMISEFCNTIRRFSRLGRVMGDPGGPSGPADALKSGLRMLPYLGDLRKYSKITTQEYMARFRDPFLRQALGAVFDLPDFPMIAMLMTLAWKNNRDAGYPVGGSLAFARAIERRYLDLGGEIHYKSPVERVLVETAGDGPARAVGVRLRSGAEHRADTVISAADGHATIFDMLEGRYLDDKIRSYYDSLPIFQPIIQVSLGVARDLSAEPHSVQMALSRPIEVAGQARNMMGFRHLCYDPTLAPPGKSVVIVMFESNYDYWRKIADEGERYEAEKQQVATAVIDRLEERYLGLTGQIEAVDVATPLTTERYTGNWQGSMEGWLITTKTAGMMFTGGMSKTLPGLDRFYMAGQWVEPGGGVPTAAQSGRKIIQMLCKRDGTQFMAALPSAVAPRPA